MVDDRVARGWHLATAVVTGTAILGQLILVVAGSAALIPEAPPPMGTRIWQFFSYFTIQANIAVVVSSLLLVRSLQLRTNGERLWRTSALLGITITGLVFAILLAPLVNLSGIAWWIDKGLHLISPILTLVGWLLFSPRRQLDLRLLLWALLWPAVWLVYTLVVGALRGWYPYPFLDPRNAGVGAVVVACLGITVAFVLVGLALVWLDQRLPALRRR